MGFYRIIKKTIRFVLYQLPKKWLIMIIFALLMLFGLTKVQAATYIDNIDINNLTCYEYIDTGGNLVDTDICLTPGSYNNHANYQLYIEYLQSSRSYANAFSINDEEQNDETSQSSMLLQQQYQNGQWYFRIDKDWNTQDVFAMNGFTKYSLYINMYDKYVSISNGSNFSHTYNFGNYTNDFYSTRTVKLNSNKDYKSGSFYIYFMELTDYLPSVDRVVTLARYYPAKYVHYIDATTSQIYTGFYNSVNNDFLVWKVGDYQYFGNVIDTPTYTDPGVDYSESLVNINNSINDTNNFLQDTNISNSSIQQPNVPQDSTGVQTGVNNIFTTIMNVFTNLDTTQNVVLPIPFTNKSITIPGSYTRDMLTQSGATWLLSFITLFWWYIISRFIIKDVLKSVEKIQTGDVEHLENSNIKGDML